MYPVSYTHLTAGIRRKSKVEESLEYYSVLRAIKTIKRADVCILMLDGKEGLTEQDKRIAGIAAEELKPIVVVVNKWDLVDKNKVTMKSMREELYAELPFLSYAPIEFVSALTGQRTTKILEISDTIYEEYTKRISTGLLNTVLKEAVLMNNPPTRKGRVVKINYADVYKRQKYESLFDEDETMLDAIDGERINKWFFNEGTKREVIRKMMEEG